MSRFKEVSGRTFRSLRIRNYRLYFVGQIVSLTGTWMQSVAQAWLVLRLTGSGVALGATTALQFLPILLAGPWGGLIADRVDKRRLVIWTQVAAALLALTLGLLTVFGLVRLWMVLLLALGLGVVTLVDMPTRQSFIYEVVGRENLINAVSLNGVIVNGSRVFGPALAGVLIGTVGIAVCFLINAASYLAVIAGLLMMDPRQIQRTAPVHRQRGQLRAGLRYVWTNPGLRMPLLLMAVVGSLAFNFSVVFPLLVRFTFGRDAQAYGTLFSLMGVGAVLGGLVVAWRGRATVMSLSVAAALFGALLFGVAAAPSLVLLMLAVVPMGAASTAFIAASNSLLQLGSTAEMRGRVMALFTMVFLGSTPIGGLIVGWVAERFGPRIGVGLGAAVSLLAGLAALAILRHRRVAPTESRPGPAARPEGVGGQPSPSSAGQPSESWARIRSSAPGFSRLDRSPGSSPRAAARRVLRMILALRVFGSS